MFPDGRIVHISALIVWRHVAKYIICIAQITFEFINNALLVDWRWFSAINFRSSTVFLLVEIVSL